MKGTGVLSDREEKKGAKKHTQKAWNSVDGRPQNPRWTLGVREEKESAVLANTVREDRPPFCSPASVFRARIRTPETFAGAGVDDGDDDDDDDDDGGAGGVCVVRKMENSSFSFFPRVVFLLFFLSSFSLLPLISHPHPFGSLCRAPPRR